MQILGRATGLPVPFSYIMIMMMPIRSEEGRMEVGSNCGGGVQVVLTQVLS